MPALSVMNFVTGEEDVDEDDKWKISKEVIAERTAAAERINAELAASDNAFRAAQLAQVPAPTAPGQASTSSQPSPPAQVPAPTAPGQASTSSQPSTSAQVPAPTVPGQASTPSQPPTSAQAPAPTAPGQAFFSSQPSALAQSSTSAVPDQSSASKAANIRVPWKGPLKDPQTMPPFVRAYEMARYDTNDPNNDAEADRQESFREEIALKPGPKADILLPEENRIENFAIPTIIMTNMRRLDKIKLTRLQAVLIDKFKDKIVLWCNKFTNAGFDLDDDDEVKQHPDAYEKRTTESYRSHILCTAEICSGKTLAYLILVLKFLLDHPPSTMRKDTSPQAQAFAMPIVLILVPSRDLVIMIGHLLVPLCKGTNLKVCFAYGGTNVSSQARTLLDGCDILVATPGRLNHDCDLPWQLSITDAPKRLVSLANVSTAVYDEADTLLNGSFDQELRKLESHFGAFVKRGLNFYIFSAYYGATAWDRAEEMISTKYAKVINYAKMENAVSLEDFHLAGQTSYNIKKAQWLGGLIALLFAKNFESRIMILTDKRQDVERIAGHLRAELRLPAIGEHGRMYQDIREQAVLLFSYGAAAIYVATFGVGGKGLNMPDVDVLVILGLPSRKRGVEDQVSTYKNSVGRVARLGHSGEVIVFYDKDGDLGGLGDLLPKNHLTFDLNPDIAAASAVDSAQVSALETKVGSGQGKQSAEDLTSPDHTSPPHSPSVSANQTDEVRSPSPAHENLLDPGQDHKDTENLDDQNDDDQNDDDQNDDDQNEVSPPDSPGTRQRQNEAVDAMDFSGWGT